MTPEEKIQRLRDGFDAFTQQDFAKLTEFFADDIKWHEPPGTRLGGDYNGRDDVFGRLFSAIPQDWDEFVFDTHDVLSNGEHTVALINWRGKSKHTGKSYTDHFVFTTHIDDNGRLTEAWAAWNTVQLKEALGD